MEVNDAKIRALEALAKMLDEIAALARLLVAKEITNEKGGGN